MSLKDDNWKGNKLSTFNGVREPQSKKVVNFGEFANSIGKAEKLSIGVEEPRQKMVDNLNVITSTNVDESGCEEITNFDNKRTSSDKNRQNTPNGGEGSLSQKVDNLTNLPKTEIQVPNPTYKIFIIGRHTLTYCATFGAGK